MKSERSVANGNSAQYTRANFLVYADEQIFCDKFSCVCTDKTFNNNNNNNNTSYIAHLSITMISALRIRNIDKI